MNFKYYNWLAFDNARGPGSRPQRSAHIAHARRYVEEAQLPRKRRGVGYIVPVKRRTMLFGKQRRRRWEGACRTPPVRLVNSGEHRRSGDCLLTVQGAGDDLLDRELPIPGQELVERLDVMVVDTGEGICEPGLRVDGFA
jgi:hypothetical protein